MDSSGMVWILVMSPFVWGNIMMRHVPSTMEVVLVNMMVRVMSSDWMVLVKLVLGEVMSSMGGVSGF